MQSCIFPFLQAVAANYLLVSIRTFLGVRALLRKDRPKMIGSQGFTPLVNQIVFDTFTDLVMFDQPVGWL